MRLALVAVALALVALVAGCRDDLCVQDISAMCPCSDPFNPELTMCMATVEKVTCDNVKVDPCVENPCCVQPPDMAVPRPDLFGIDFAHAQDASVTPDAALDGVSTDSASSDGASPDSAGSDGANPDSAAHDAAPNAG